MNICIIRNSEADITTSFYRIVDAVLESGNKPILLSRNRETEKICINKKVYNFRNLEIENFEINIPSKRGAGLKNIFQLLIYQIIVFYWLIKNRKKYDLIHSFDLDSGIPSTFVSKIMRHKHIYHIADFYSDSRSMPTKLKSIFKKLEIKIINLSDYTLICNEDRLEQIKGNKQSNIGIIHNTPVIDEEILKYIEKNKLVKRKDNKLRICYVGTLSETRFILQVLDIVKDLEDVEIDIAGVGKIEEKVKNMASKSNNIFYHGKLKYEDALKLYSECDIMFAIYDPSIANHRYSAPNKIYEAMILQKPIIVAKNTGMDIIVEKNDMGLVINYNKEEFINSIKYLMNNIEILECMGKNGKCAYEKYNWDVMKMRLKGIYNELER